MTKQLELTDFTKTNTKIIARMTNQTRYAFQAYIGCYSTLKAINWPLTFQSPPFMKAISDCRMLIARDQRVSI